MHHVEKLKYCKEAIVLFFTSHHCCVANCSRFRTSSIPYHSRTLLCSPVNSSALIALAFCSFHIQMLTVAPHKAKYHIGVSLDPPCPARPSATSVTVHFKPNLCSVTSCLLAVTFSDICQT